MFSRDVKDFRYQTPRTLQTSKFGAYSKLHVPQRRSRIAPVLWMLAYGVAVGVFLYLLVLVRA